MHLPFIGFNISNMAWVSGSWGSILLHVLEVDLNIFFLYVDPGVFIDMKSSVFGYL